MREDPCDLLYIGKQIGVRQHRAFGKTGGTAGVLQQCDVLCRNRFVRCLSEQPFTSVLERVLERHAVELFTQGGIGEAAFAAARQCIDQQRFWRVEQIARRR